MNDFDEGIIQNRKRFMGSKAATLYDRPIHLVKADGVWMWEANGKKYLDCYNNVPHVGHCHPKVTEAIWRQTATLNTHTRYLHQGILNYLERLIFTFEKQIECGILTCTGSEANDIALRMAETYTGKSGVIATDHTYHGNTATVSQLSLTNAPKIGSSKNVRFVPSPDSYRPLGENDSDEHALLFSIEVRKKIEELNTLDCGFSSIIICPFFANEGFPTLPKGFLDKTIEVVREANGLIIADEVQPGFGRLGSHMWGHQRIGLEPDIITLGKPMGNGYPIGGVLTSSQILDAFQKSFRYFNTFGGNPVACAAANAVLDVLDEEKLLEKALSVGKYSVDRLNRLKEKFWCIGDVRGAGLFFGAEFVHDRETKEPNPILAHKVVIEMLKEGILINRSGVEYSTLKIRPNLQFSMEHADILINTLEKILTRLNF